MAMPVQAAESVFTGNDLQSSLQVGQLRRMALHRLQGEPRGIRPGRLQVRRVHPRAVPSCHAGTQTSCRSQALHHDQAQPQARETGKAGGMICAHRWKNTNADKCSHPFHTCKREEHSKKTVHICICTARTSPANSMAE